MGKSFARFVMAASCAMAAPASAALLMEFRSSNGEPTQMMWIEGDLARIEGGGEPGTYSVFDLKNGRVYGVVPSQKQIIEYELTGAEGAGTTDKKARQAKVALEDLGAGPRIAGYATQHYVLKGDDEVCGEFFLSREALADTGMRDVMGSLREIAAAVQESDPSYDPCEQAATFMIGEYLKRGLPMRQINADGEMDHEIVRIDKRASLPAGGTDLPKSYRRVSMQEYISQEMKKYQQTPDRK